MVHSIALVNDHFVAMRGYKAGPKFTGEVIDLESPKWRCRAAGGDNDVDWQMMINEDQRNLRE